MLFSNLIGVFVTAYFFEKQYLFWFYLDFMIHEINFPENRISAIYI